jgi:hypothetical protein
MDSRVRIGNFHIKIMKQSCLCPFFRIAAQPKGECPHHSFRRQRMGDHSFILYITPEQIKCFISWQ